jgi:integral membrane sensor domain MASE1
MSTDNRHSGVSALSGMRHQATTNSGWVAYTVRLALLSLAYFATAKLGLLLATTHANVTLIWAPTGIATAALLLFGLRMAPAIALGALLANATTDATLGFVLATAAVNPCQALVCAYVLRRFDFHDALDRSRDVLALALAGAASSVLSAAVGASSLCATGMASWDGFDTIMWTWWVGDSMGVLVVAPLILAWGTSREGEWSPSRIAEVSVLFASLAGISFLVYGGHLATETGRSLSFAIFPFLIWAALRFGRRETATAVVLTIGVAVWGSASSQQPL